MAAPPTTPRRCAPRRSTTVTSRWARSSPSSAAGRCRWSTPAGVVKEHTAVREAVGVFDVSHLGKALVSGPGAADVRQRDADQRPRPDRARQGAVHAVLRRRDRRRRRRPDRLPACRRRGLPGPERREHRRGRPPAAGGAPDGVDGRRPAPRLRGARRAGPASPTRCSPRSGCPAGHEYMSFVEVEHERRAGRRLPHRLHRRARLRAGRRRTPPPSRCGTRCWPPGEQYGMLPCGLGARDTLRTEMGYPLHGQDISPRRSPRSRRGSAGRSAGRSPRSGAATRCSPRRRQDRARLLRGLVAAGRASRARTCGCSSRPASRSARSRPGPSRPTLAQGGRAGAALDAQVADGDEVGGRRTRPPRDVPRDPAAVRGDGVR